MHFFSPVEKMPLLEVITTPKTAPWATATAVAVGRKMGKHVIVVQNRTGFYTTRVLGPYMVEAIWLLSEGVPIQEIDTAMTRFGFPLGPVALMDEVGLDVGAKVTKILYEAFGDRFKVPESLAKLFKSDRLGKKNGRGFYLYPSDNGKKKQKGPRLVDPTIREFLPTNSGYVSETDIQARCSLVFLNEAVRCLEEGVLASPRDGDVGAVFGLGFPPFRGGPFRYLDHLTAAGAVRQLERLERLHGSRFKPAARLLEMATQGRTFY
jgi:3-hydroxyacyl-CoA dehydrogenase/enoyl-CoA hydratase/3-hydroxybutyryl-CoA epimerase